jgi:hypothetical protein
LGLLTSPSPAEIHLRRHLAKGGAFGKIEVLSAVVELLRERKTSLPCAPEPESPHAASEEALLGRFARLSEPSLAASLLTSKAPEPARPAKRREPRPRRVDGPQRP